MNITTTKKETVPKLESFDKYLEYTLGNSNKFWGIKWVDDESMSIYWGRIDGSNCQTHTKTFEYHLEAVKWLSDKISEKSDKGYA